MKHEKTLQVLNCIDSALVEECAVCPGSVLSERNGMKKRRTSTRRLAALIAAACLLLALGVTAYATGAIQSLISRYWGSFQYRTPDDALRQERPDYAQWLDEQLETQAMMLGIGEKAVQTQEAYPIPRLDGAGITLLEYYYDGEKIALGCQFHRPRAQVDFGFDAEAYPNLPFQTVEAEEYPSYRSLVKSQAELEAIEEKLQKEGAVSFLVSDCWLSDHILANDSDLGPCHGDPDENGLFTIDPIIMGMGEVELPQSCRNQEAVTVTMTYRVVTYAFRLEGASVEYARVGTADYPVRFTIPNLNPDSIPARWSMEALGTPDAGEKLRFCAEVRGQSFEMDAIVPQAQEIQTVWLQEDASLFEKLGRTLIAERFPQAQAALDSGSRDISLSDEATGNLLLSFDSSMEGIPGMLHYLDVQRDLNGSSLDGWETVFTPHYVTSTIPEGMSASPEAAIGEVTSLLESHSCFRFSPWNVQAEYDQQKQQGCYRITLMPEYEGMPIYGQRTTTRAFYSDDGVFACQGMLLLRERQRQAVDSPISWAQAVESVVNSLPEISSYDTLRCTAIHLGYLAETQESEVILAPAWVFECSETREDSTHALEIAVSLETGKLGCIQNGKQTWIDPA